MTPKCTLANSEDPDEILHNAALHQGLRCLLLLSETLTSEKEIQFLLGNYNLNLYNGPFQDYCNKPEGRIY